MDMLLEEYGVLRPPGHGPEVSILILMDMLLEEPLRRFPAEGKQGNGLGVCSGFYCLPEAYPSE